MQYNAMHKFVWVLDKYGSLQRKNEGGSTDLFR